ncbi:MAG: DNA-binding protein [Magnetococcales bacterium]|nr:DNA-binding protein [Magnetococcales bacterium]
MSPTNDTIKERVFRRRGITVTQWARENNFPLQDVYRVLNGRLKAHYGRAHEIAVRLGMKPASAA